MSPFMQPIRPIVEMRSTKLQQFELHSSNVEGSGLYQQQHDKRRYQHAYPARQNLSRMTRTSSQIQGNKPIKTKNSGNSNIKA